MHKLAQLDHCYVWHPFTQMQDWLQREPIVIVSGEGAVLRDVHDREYLDANSSIWTNLHGHNHPRLNAAIVRQLKKIAHSSALGLANEPASLLAERLVQAANPPRLDSSSAKCPPSLVLGHQSSATSKTVRPAKARTGTPPSSESIGAASGLPHLGKVFFSDDGSTALEVALKLAYEFARRTGRSARPRFLSVAGAYHGDTIGAVSLGHIDLFHKAYAGLLFKTDHVMAPYCYRCPFNRAQPERADARTWRRCHWECVAQVEQSFVRQNKRGLGYAAMLVEPLIQGAAGMIPQPAGWLRQVAEIVRAHGAQLIADEVMTGFGRTGAGEFREPISKSRSRRGDEAQMSLASEPHEAGCHRSAIGPRSSNVNSPILFASHHEGVQPDFLALAKGLTGGYLPMAATLTTSAVFEAFRGEYAEFKTFFHGHSYTANQLGAAAGLASLDLLQSAASRRARQRLEGELRHALAALWSRPQVGDIRQVGLIAGIELVRDWRTRAPYDLCEQAGIRVCQVMARRGVLTRPIGNVVVVMPPYCTTPLQVRRMVTVLGEAIDEVFHPANRG